MKKKYCKLWIEMVSLAQADILTMSTTDKEVADVDYDGKVSIKDATLIQKEVAGLPS